MWFACDQRVNATLKAHRYFIGRKGGVVDPPTCVVKQVPQPNRNLRPFAADVFVGLAKRASPCPSLGKHLLVQLALGAI
jgi:hypothetical protein